MKRTLHSGAAAVAAVLALSGCFSAPAQSDVHEVTDRHLEPYLVRYVDIEVDGKPAKLRGFSPCPDKYGPIVRMFRSDPDNSCINIRGKTASVFYFRDRKSSHGEPGSSVPVMVAEVWDVEKKREGERYVTYVENPDGRQFFAARNTRLPGY